MEQKPYFLNVKFLRQILIAADDLLHFAVAATLMVCAGLILARTIPNLFDADTTAILHVLNDVLLALIVMELMWPIIRFLKRKPFSLNPFLYIGIISSTRRILMIEAEHSMLGRLSAQPKEWPELWPVLAELGANVTIILVLAFALRLLAVAQKADVND
ncbi:MAG: phosphate-starvation-inducible PsiE family protein [Desulfobulbaceae bacterium]|nr:phosphate-starvation-inducible PsiE family protein [Desulfobulbaceae bacterium]